MNKKIAGLAIVMACCIIVVACFCSFAPPVVEWTQYNVSNLTVTDVENLIAITDFQDKYGSFNSYIPVACQLNGNYIRIYCVPREATWSFTESNGTYTLTSNLNGNTYIMRSNFTETGFGMQYTGSSATIPENYLLFFRMQDGNYVRNENFSYATGNVDNDVIANCAAAWFETWKVVDGYETAIEEAESVGFESGFDVGYADGLDQGFADGFEEGESRGYESGFDNGYGAGYRQGEFDGISSGYEYGYSDGESIGYESGFDRGYAEGFIDGYDTGKAEGGGNVTIYEPSFELDIPEIFDGMFEGVGGVLSAFDIELFGINIVGVLLSLLIIAIVAFIVRRLMK